MKRRAALSGLACLVGGVATAPPCLAADEDLYFSSLPIVATVSRLPQAQADAPGSVTVIDREMIRASGVRDLNDVFRLVPGFQTYPFNNDYAPKVTYHGLTEDTFAPRIQVLLDGRSMYSPLFQGGVNWAAIPVALEDIDRIEVMRGSNSAAYGANAFLGVINIITADPSQVRGVSISGNYGNQGVRDTTLRTGGRLGEVGDFRFTYQQRADTGLTDRHDWTDGFRQKIFDLRAGLQLTDRDELQVSLGHVEGVLVTGRYQTANSTVVLPKTSDPGYPVTDVWQANSFLQAEWRRTLGPGADVRVRYAHVEDSASGRRVEECSTFLCQMDGYGRKGTRDEIELQHAFSPGATTRLVWGGGARWEDTYAPDLFYGEGNVRRRVFRLFGNLEWKPASWLTVNAGSSLDNDSLAGTTFSPRLNASFHLDDRNTIRLGISRAHRAPSAYELRGDARAVPFSTIGGVPVPAGTAYSRNYLADGNLEPERIDSIELGYLGDWREQRMSLDVRAFHERIPNRIISLRRTLPPEFCNLLNGVCDPAINPATAMFAANAQNVRIEGLEYQWRWQPLENTRLLFNQAFVQIQASYLGSINPATGVNSFNGWSLSEGPNNLQGILTHARQSSPSHSSTAMLMQKLPGGLEFSATQHWVGPMKWSRNSEVLGYKRLDLRLGYPFRVGPTRGEIAWVIQSANGEHGEYKYNPMSSDVTRVKAGRIVSERQWLTLRLDF